MSLFTFELRSSRREELIDVTKQVWAAVSRSGVTDGLCCLWVPHTTAAVCVNEAADPSVARDILDYLRQAVPQRGDYRHLEGNSDAHIKSTLVGAAETIPVQAGKLVLGTWQGIFFCEFDGPRTRRLHVKVTAG
ncbi:MAG: secondary thiamine-phosphate synthase enzyme YjbQ [Bacillota bacterium]